MPRFEVHIPPSAGQELNLTLRVEADNWMAALKTGLQKLGEQGPPGQSVLVDIQDDNSLHVTDSGTGRVFRIRELSEEEALSARVKRPSTPPPPSARTAPATAGGAVTVPARGGPEPVTQPSTSSGAPTLPSMPPVTPGAAATVPTVPTVPARTEAVTLPAIPALVAPPVQKAQSPTALERPALERPAPPVHEPSVYATVAAPVVRAPAPTPIGLSREKSRSNSSPPREVVELEQPTRPITGPIGRARSGISRAPALEDLLAEVFDRVQGVYAAGSPEKAMYLLLDLAMEKVPAEAGSVLQADAFSGDLHFVAARGPKAKELLQARLRLPAGTGIAGFCAMEGVSLALSDVQKDPRYYAAVADRVDFDVRSVLCAPMMTHGRTFGCMQLLNRKDGSPFEEHEVGLLAYIAHQGALFLNTL